ncbi:TPA: hypothetical protein DDW69_02365 [candidate division CPR2 bacterium]|uniref:DUF1540 domain-containing protein n=1 Tax=candidate division CPR2 bacterium GW2011_GWC1_41_48 TaxID=1618344 RepID=A0A0G0WA61_UNCC2|nr:MAG: hypothetical protein UT47_C0001G0275 [candidate division CPR2 bacterium GW2011_GWC2_39_35]KKR28871.1 MAG: hypothetical protein UT59_C0017G0005 [candidate division CPR2 bacterium GW2011_GWD1_39_7]KKR29156.1 MAG: hypothetical protein UT60_C0006G0019 [candidate division CPR2 bacterium GW2011_GWD2_39_7]KKS09870.1 MAG: hypothetical protein UU65_C0001G0275 [candidate division CPR2 bacterium GW2011_GWC1_41_48]OGB61499.1 MAG: hypothetical protein A2Y27_02495 [candidate division CPR2 bacterium G
MALLISIGASFIFIKKGGGEKLMEERVDIGCSATDCEYNNRDGTNPHCVAKHIYVHIHTGASKIAECETYTAQVEDVEEEELNC